MPTPLAMASAAVAFELSSMPAMIMRPAADNVQSNKGMMSTADSTTEPMNGIERTNVPRKPSKAPTMSQYLMLRLNASAIPTEPPATSAVTGRSGVKSSAAFLVVASISPPTTEGSVLSAYAITTAELYSSSNSQSYAPGVIAAKAARPSPIS